MYDYRTDTTVNQPIVDESSNAAFDIVYANAQGEKKRCPVYECGSSASVATITELVGKRNGRQFDQKDLVGEQTLDLNADETGKVSSRWNKGAYRHRSKRRK